MLFLLIYVVRCSVALGLKGRQHRQHGKKEKQLNFVCLQVLVCCK